MPEEDFARARLVPVDRATKKAVPSKAIEVHFNPETLKLTRSNTIKAEPRGRGQRGDPAQHIDASSSKLAFDLVFDSTLEEDEAAGYKDVRQTTQKLIKTFMDPEEPQAGSGSAAPKPVPAPLCVFSWGSFFFAGIVESMNETIEFFSPNGVPLRAVLAVSMMADKFDYTPEPVRRAARATPDFVPVAPAAATPEAVSAAGGDPKAWRDTALYNGLETPRFPDSSALAVPGVSLSGSVGISGGISGGVSGGVTAGAAAGISGGMSAGISAPGPGFSFGGSAKLGTSVPGAFGGGVQLGGTASIRLGRK
jgi:hypothetical protein